MKSLVTGRRRPKEFRSVLAGELARRCNANPRYSLRAFARSLEIDHSSLSQILRGRRRLTESTIRRLGPRLGLNEDAIAEHLAAARAGGESMERSERERLTADTVELLADWHHFAILELCGVKGFEADSRWVARVLDIDIDEVNLAVQRLLRLGMMRLEGSRWIDTSGRVLGEIEDFHEATIRRLASQLDKLAVSSLHSSAPEQREFSVVTVGVSGGRLSAAFGAIARLREEIGRLFEDEPTDSVYKLEINFFPVTNPLEKEEEK